jgi:hypothetical protein
MLLYYLRLFINRLNRILVQCLLICLYTCTLFYGSQTVTMSFILGSSTGTYVTSVDRMVVGYTNTYAASAYHLRQVDGFLRILRFPPPKPPRYN